MGTWTLWTMSIKRKLRLVMRGQRTRTKMDHWRSGQSNWPLQWAWFDRGEMIAAGEGDEEVLRWETIAGVVVVMMIAMKEGDFSSRIGEMIVSLRKSGEWTTAVGTGIDQEEEGDVVEEDPKEIGE